MIGDDERPATEDPAELPVLQVGGHELVVVSVPAPQVPADELTAAEQSVVRGIAEGLTNAELAERRQVARSTIANQIASIFRKLGVSSRAELLARLARRTDG